MKKLITKFNEKYGKAYGSIDHSLTNERIYVAYRFIKTLCEKDSEIYPYLKAVKLPLPTSPIETVLYADCLRENRVSWNDLLDAPFGRTKQNIKYKFIVNEDVLDSDLVYQLGNTFYYLLTEDDNYSVFENPGLTTIYVDGKRVDVPLKKEGYCIMYTEYGLALDLSLVYGNYYTYSCGYELFSEHEIELVSYETVDVENELTDEYLNIDAILSVFEKNNGVLPAKNLDLKDVNNRFNIVDSITEVLQEEIESVDSDLQAFKKNSVDTFLQISQHNLLKNRVSDVEEDVTLINATLNELPTDQDVRDLIAQQVSGDKNVLNDYVKKIELHTVATSGDYNDLRYKPTIVSNETIQGYDADILAQAKAYVDEQLDGLADILDQIEGGGSEESGE